MHGLVGKLRTLGHEHTLALEFRLASVTPDPGLDYKAYFPKFRGVGRLRILDTSSGKAFDITVRSFMTCIISLFLTCLLVNWVERNVFLNCGRRLVRVFLGSHTPDLRAGGVTVRFGTTRLVPKTLLLV